AATARPQPRGPRQKQRPARATGWSRSNLNLDDLLNPEVADGLHHRRTEQQHLTHVLAKQRLHVPAVDHGERDAESARQRQQDVAGHTTVRRVNPNLTKNLESLADDSSEIVENL